MDLKEKTAKWPLEVVYPFGGRFYGLLHSTYNEGNYLLIAKNEDQLLGMFSTLLKDDERAPEVLKAYYVGNFVSPPEWLAENYAKSCYERAVDSAFYSVGNALNSYRDFYKKLPPGTRQCKAYRSKYKDEDGSTPSTDHYDCDNCFRGIDLAGGLTQEEIYERIGDLAEKSQPSTSARSRWRRSQAPAPVQGLPVYGISADHGHHNHGNIVKELSPEEFTRSYMRDCYLAYFQGEIYSKVPQPFSSMHTKLIEEHKQWKKQQEKKHEAALHAGNKSRADEALVYLERLKR